MGIASLTPLKQTKGEVNVEKRAKRACGQVGAGRKCGQIAEVWRSQGCYHNARALLDAALVEDQFVATTRPVCTENPIRVYRMIESAKLAR